MTNFFTFYENINELPHPFVAFSFSHMIIVFLIGSIIWYLFRWYSHLKENQKNRFLYGMAIFFILEELIYAGWLLINCHNHILLQILPLELCSIVVYVNIASIFLKKDMLRFFSAIVGLFAGMIAIIYPVNISELYPIFSYRVLNFYLMHGAFVLFALIQLKDRSLLSYRHLKKNTLLLCVLFTIAFIVNIYMHSQYMFVGAPPKFVFALFIFQRTGFLFFLPAVLILVSIIQTIFLFVLRKIYAISKSKI